MSKAPGTAMTTLQSASANPVDSFYDKWTLAAVVFFIALEAAYFVMSGLPSFFQPSLDFTGNAIGRDFLTTWMGARSVMGYGPAAWFDPAVYNTALRVMFGPDFPDHFWSYPPHLLLFTWPLGLLPYLLAYVLWCAVGIACYLFASARVVRREHLLFLAAAPGVAVCVFFGQNGFFTAALLIGGLVSLRSHPIFAGVLFGILTVQPQLGILLPVMLLVTGRWLTIATAAVTAATLMATTAFLFGGNVWTDFVEKVLPHQGQLMQNAGELLYVMVSSVFFGGRLVGFPLDIAWYAQGAVSLLAVAAVVWTYYRPRDELLSIALLITATFLASPYVLNYDMVVFGFVVAALRQRDDNRAVDHWLGLAVWSLPVTMMIFGVASIPLAPIVLLLFAARLVWRLVHSEKAGDASAPAATIVAAAA